MTILDVHDARLAILADAMTDDNPAALLPAIAPGIRVSLYVSDCPDRVSGVVERVNGAVAEVRLSSGAIATRNVEFLTVVSPR